MDIIDAARNINKTHENDVLAKLTTIWGEKLDIKHVLEEYPRPQLKRDNYTILNGLWNYAITASGDAPTDYDGQILVPFSPESSLSGVERQLKPDEYLWYQRVFTITEKEYTFTKGTPAHRLETDAPKHQSSSKRLLLHFGAVDQTAVVYVNNRKVCSHTGGYLPFEADITDFLKEGENLLTLKVQDVSDTSYHSRGKQTLKRGGMFYTAQSGIWQTVWMEWVPETYIKKLYLTPDYDKGAISIELLTTGTAPVTLQIFAEDVCICETAYDGGVNHRSESGTLNTQGNISSENTDSVSGTSDTLQRISLSTTLPERHPWTPDSPFLYRIKIFFGEDIVESYFALRCFTIESDEKGIPRFCLNHKPIFLHGVLDQGYWPDGLYTAPSDEALIFDIRSMQKLGFNMMRKHIKIESARWYYHCDRLGMIVWQDMVSGGSHYSMPMVCYLPTLFLASQADSPMIIISSSDVSPRKDGKNGQRNA